MTSTEHFVENPQPTRTTLERIAALRAEFSSLRSAHETEERAAKARIDALTARLAHGAMQPVSVLLAAATLTLAAAVGLGFFAGHIMNPAAHEQASVIPEPPVDFARELASPGTSATQIAEVAELALVEAEIPLVSGETEPRPASPGSTAALPTTRPRLAARPKAPAKSASSANTARAMATSRVADPLSFLDNCDDDDPLCGL